MCVFCFFGFFVCDFGFFAWLVLFVLPQYAACGILVLQPGIETKVQPSLESTESQPLDRQEFVFENRLPKSSSERGDSVDLGWGIGTGTLKLFIVIGPCVHFL